MSRRTNAVSGEQLIAKWGTDEYGLSYLTVKHDLTVIDPPTIPILKGFLRPRYLGTDSEERLKIITIHPYRLRQKLFLLAEVERIPSKECLSLPPKTESTVLYSLKDVPSARSEPKAPEKAAKPLDAGIKKTIEEHESEIKKNPNVFSLIGKVWFIKFQNQEWGLYPDQEKYKYIANLLSLSNDGPKKNGLEYSIYNVDLMGKVKGRDIAEHYQNDDKQDDLSPSNLAEKLTTEELESIKGVGNDLLRKLKDLRDSGNQKQVDEAQTNIDKYRSYLLNEYGIKTVVSKDESRFSYKTLHRPGKENEKLRQLVKNQINNAVKDFKDHMPMFGRHLRHSLKTKLYETLYSPENHIAWHISM